MGRKVILLALALCLCWSGVAQSPGVTRDAGKLQLHQTVERELGPGLTDLFTLEASAGQFIHLVAQKKTVDVVLVALDADGKILLTADSPNSVGPVPVSWIAPTAGAYSVRVSQSARSREAGRYQLEWQELRNPTETDKTRMQAETKLYAAAAQQRAADRERRPQAIALYRKRRHFGID